MSRRIFIVGRKDAVSRVSFDGKSAKAQDYEAAVPASVEACTRINCLAVLTRTMEQLSTLDLSKEHEPTVVYTIGMVADAISRGTFKYWLLNAGKKLSGEALNATEMELWTKFSGLYKDMFEHIIIKNVSDCTLPKNSKFTISQDQRLDAEYAEKAWDRVKVIVPEIEESESEAL